VPGFAVSDPLAEELDDAAAGAEAFGPEDPLEQPARMTVRATNIPTATRIGTVSRSRLNAPCAVAGSAAQPRRSRTVTISSRPGPTPTAEMGARIMSSSAAT
jgi:hypothetical protein